MIYSIYYKGIENKKHFVKDVYIVYISEKDLNNQKFKAVTRRFKELKETEGGLNAMCKIMEDIVKEENQKILREENIKRIVKMISKGYSKEEILDLDYT